ncbi:hypothetical protein HJC99_04880 [Candidatus Saccharibacteria bacterium]|nr:hypothetical protein [Candidatus Saccharibacteria bacterium]
MTRSAASLAIRGMRRDLNALRTAFGQPELTSLPVATPCQPQDCTGHRALRDLGLGDYTVYPGYIIVDKEFAAIVAAAWGTTVLPLKEGGTDFTEERPGVATTWRIKRYITRFDDNAFPQLIDPTTATTEPVTSPELVSA